MEHWIYDVDTGGLPGWREALPEARLFRRADFRTNPPRRPGILWWRLRGGETLDEVLPDMAPLAAQHLVLLCDEPDEALTMQALAAGASGCCNARAAPEVLRQVALVVGHGGLWIGQGLLQKIVESTTRILAPRSREGSDEPWKDLLSERETQVARLVASAASNKEIARQLAISERTVKAHLTSIFDKLGLRDRLQLSLRVNGLPL